VVEALPVGFDLLEHEGLCVGGSAAVNVAGAIRLARHLGPGRTIVTILCDYGTRYQSKLFDPTFLRGENLPGGKHNGSPADSAALGTGAVPGLPFLRDRAAALT
jgi:hypothetical protein